MTEVNPPGFQQNAGAVHSAEIMREAFNVLTGGRFSNSFSQRARGGVHPNLGGFLFVSQNGTPNMSVQISTGHALVAGTEGATQGSYVCFNDATVNRTVAASDPSLPRIDIVVARVRDSVYSGATNAWALEVVTGVAASSPAVPTAPANSMILAQVAVAAGATTIVNGNITNLQPYLTAVGGLLPVRTQTERDALVGLYDGMAVWRQDTDMMQVYNGSAFLDFPGEVGLRPTRITKGSDEPISNNTLQDDDALFTGTLPANTIWRVTGQIYYTAGAAAATNGIKIGWSGPAGATFSWIPNMKIDTDGTNAATAIWKPRLEISDTINGGGAGAVQMGIDPVGELAIGGTAGIFRFRWSQATTHATATVVKAGSRLYLERVG